MVEGSISRRYARAIMELAREEGKVEAVAADLERFVALCRQDNGALGAALASPIFTLEERVAVLGRVLLALQLDGLTVNFVRLVMDKNRMSAIADIVREFRSYADVEANRVRATVTTATRLTAVMEAEVRNALAAATGKTVVIESSIDPALLGGIVARVGSTVYDASLRTRLERLQLSLSAPVRA